MEDRLIFESYILYIKKIFIYKFYGTVFYQFYWAEVISIIIETQ